MPRTVRNRNRQLFARPYVKGTCAILAALAGLSVGLLGLTQPTAAADATSPTPPSPVERVDGVATQSRWARGSGGDNPILMAEAAPRYDLSAAADTISQERQRVEEALKTAREQGREDEIVRLQQQLTAIDAARGNASGFANRQSATAMPSATPLPEGVAGALSDSDEPISIRFGESVNLKEFAEWVATGLGINIFSDPALADHRVSFIAPMSVKPKDLLHLLETLLEDQGYALTYDDQLGVYKIVQSSNVAIGFKGDQATTRVIPTPLLRPSTIQQTINATMGSGAQGTAAVRMSPVDELGVLIVTGTPPTVRTIEELVNKLLGQFANQRLFSFPLTHVSADFAVQRILTLNGRLSGGTIPGIAQGIQGQPGQQQQGLAQGGALTNLDTRLFTDQSNAIIFRGTDAEAEQIGQLVSIVDTVISLIARRYIVGNQAQLVAETGERMGLGPVTYSSTGQNQYGGLGGNSFQNRQFQSGFGNQGGYGTQTLTASGFVVDSETGSMIYHGTEQQHAIVSALVDDFNKQAIDENVELKVYKLKYIKAPETAELLQNVIQEPGQATANSPFFPRSGTNGRANNRVTQPGTTAETGEAGSEQALGGATEENTVIVPDESGNQIIIKATARAQRQFGELIKRLDRRKPQVNIQAQIISVTTSKDFDWTADVQINDGQFSFLSTFGLTSTATNSTLSTVRTVPSPSGAAFPGRGATAALIRSDFIPFAISALEAVGNIRIVSNPRILVNDNFEASVESTQKEPYSTATISTGNPTQVSQGGEAEAGTKLIVTPRISAGGDLVLEYEVELSSFDLSRQQPNLSPPSQAEKYKSEVTLPTDSTVVVGGFTIQRKNDDTERVPGLGWIPLVGALFTDFNKSNLKTTVFVFITPTVLNDDNFLDLQLISEGWIEEAGLDPDRPPMDPVTMPIAGFKPTLPEEPSDASSLSSAARAADER